MVRCRLVTSNTYIPSKWVIRELSVDFSHADIEKASYRTNINNYFLRWEGNDQDFGQVEGN